MIKPKITPGPWKHVINDLGEVVVETGAVEIWCGDMDTCGAEHLRNAEVIQAVPDMLDALCKVRSYFKGRQDAAAMAGLALNKTEQELIQAMDKALNKAEVKQ